MKVLLLTAITLSAKSSVLSSSAEWTTSAAGWVNEEGVAYPYGDLPGWNGYDYHLDDAGIQFNAKSFGLKNGMMFHFDSDICLNYQFLNFSYCRESQAISQVIMFFKPKHKLKPFLLNCPPEECRSLCQKQEGANYFTFRKKSGNCWCKVTRGGKAGPNKEEGAHSGTLLEQDRTNSYK